MYQPGVSTLNVLIRGYSLLAHHEGFRQVPVHDRLLPIVEGLLDRGCLVSSLSSVSIDAGETPQRLLVDDAQRSSPSSVIPSFPVLRAASTIHRRRSRRGRVYYACLMGHI